MSGILEIAMLRCLALLLTVLFMHTAHATVLPPRPPLMATAPDAVPIRLQSLSISSEISGTLAETTVRMVFFNPNARLLEGSLQFPLLDGQRITAFALDIDGILRPAVPVDKARGREVFESIVRRGVDPGLLEATQGNNFKLRVYPIAGGGTRTVEIKYSEALARRGAQWRYRLPLDYGSVDDFDLNIKVNDKGAPPALAGSLSDLHFDAVDGSYRARFSRQGFAAAGVVELAIDASAQPRVYRQQFQGETYFVADIPVDAPATRRAAPRTIGLLWDSSGSGARRALAADLALLERYLVTLGQVDVRLIRLRDRADKPLTFRIRGGDWSALRRELEATVYDGASALADWPAQADADEYLLFSDGLLNYGPARFPKLSARQRLFAISSAASSDSARLAGLAASHGGTLIAIDPARPAAGADALLFEQARVEQLSASGATDLMIDSPVVGDGMLRVAGKLQASGQLTLTLTRGGVSEQRTVALDTSAPPHPLAAHTWAGLRLRALEAEFDANRGEIGRIGRKFGIPTRETSLIVLERLEDYLSYEIEPPPALATAFQRLRELRGNPRKTSYGNHMDDVLRRFERRAAWWERPERNNVWPSKPMPVASGSLAMPPPPPSFRQSEAEPSVENVIVTGQRASLSSAMSIAPAAPAAKLEFTPGPEFRRIAAAAPGAGSRVPAQPTGGTGLAKWVPNAPYVERLRDAPREQVYALYLDEKPSYENSSAFFLDVADILVDKGQRDLALRVLSNLAEMDLENRAVLRILGYRLLQAGAPQLAVPVFEKVLLLAQEEPQSWRDLGLAYAAAGQPQLAIDKLYEVVIRPWNGRFPEIDAIALAEMNAIIATSKVKLDVSRMDPRLLKNMPLDLRVVMTWDADASDMDLRVIDPSGEQCDYRNPNTRQGGRISRDFVGGYGPEEFSLRQARPGKYRVEANYYGNRQQVIAGATTLQVKVFTGFGTKEQKEQMVTLRLKERGETVFVGEFDLPGAVLRFPLK